jgi:hypothetical protein
MPDSRAQLLLAQSSLMRCLVLKQSLPNGFDAERIGLASGVLLSKRRRAIRREFSGTAASLGGERFHKLFEDFARTHFLPAGGGSKLDGIAFLLFLRKRGLLSRTGELELIAADISIAAANRTFKLRVKVLNSPAELVIAANLPHVGAKTFSIRVLPRRVST